MVRPISGYRLNQPSIRICYAEPQRSASSPQACRSRRSTASHANRAQGDSAEDDRSTVRTAPPRSPRATAQPARAKPRDPRSANGRRHEKRAPAKPPRAPRIRSDHRRARARPPDRFCVTRGTRLWPGRNVAIHCASASMAPNSPPVARHSTRRTCCASRISFEERRSPVKCERNR